MIKITCVFEKCLLGNRRSQGMLLVQVHSPGREIIFGLNLGGVKRKCSPEGKGAPPELTFLLGGGAMFNLGV